MFTATRSGLPALHCAASRQLDQMRPAEIQAAAAAGVPVLVPIGVLENHGYHLPCGVDLVSARAVAELASQLTEAVVAPPLSYCTPEQAFT